LAVNPYFLDFCVFRLEVTKPPLTIVYVMPLGSSVFGHICSTFPNSSLITLLLHVIHMSHCSLLGYYTVQKCVLLWESMLPPSSR
jgi:hypothetical protein